MPAFFVYKTVKLRYNKKYGILMKEGHAMLISLIVPCYNEEEILPSTATVLKNKLIFTISYDKI